MGTKLNKINKDIQKIEQIMIEWQNKLKALEKKKINIENLEMIDFLRKNSVSHGDLKTMIDLLHEEKGTIIPLKTK